MRTTCDPHYPLWRPEDRAPITLAQIGRVPAGTRYRLRPVDLSTDDRGAHMTRKAKERRAKQMRLFVSIWGKSRA